MLEQLIRNETCFHGETHAHHKRTQQKRERKCVCVSLDVWADRLCVCVCAMSCQVQWTFFSCSFLHKMDLKWLTWFNMQKKSCSTHFLTVRQLVEIRRGTHLLEVVNEELGVKPLQGPTWHSTAQHNSITLTISGSNLVQIWFKSGSICSIQLGPERSRNPMVKVSNICQNVSNMWQVVAS